MRLGTSNRWASIAIIGLAITGSITGCSDDADVMPGADAGSRDAGSDAGGNPTDAGTDTGTDAGPNFDGGPRDAGNDAGGPSCPALGARTAVDVTADITANTTWSCANTYTLKAKIFVISPAVLTIQAGTVILGDAETGLLVARGGRLDAIGTAGEPIVFTSSKVPSARERGDWGGVALLGGAPINTGAEGALEGLPTSDTRGVYGGSSTTHNCGTLRYVRIEFAGFELFTDNELNGLTVAGCGSETSLDYIQVHKGLDDGVEFFGGNANIKHLIISQTGDDGLDWDEGWTGKAQFLIVQQDSVEGDTAFESDNFEDGHDFTPRSSPTIYNATLIGGNASASQRGMTLRRGTAGVMRNFIVAHFPDNAIDVRDRATVMQTTGGTPALTVDNAIFFDIEESGTDYFPNEPTEMETTTECYARMSCAEGMPGAACRAECDRNDDYGFDESAFFMATARSNRFGVDPMLGAATNLTAPSFLPASGSPAATGAATPPTDTFFDNTATFVGAIAPGGTDWTAGWSSYP